mmetsp:Transcript_24953/g.73283  ORF Transcript_24953/g.73283 Transcript_24953/m.73283 type:complete len:313 (-) Transcript_24953:789-1727(-)
MGSKAVAPRTNQAVRSRARSHAVSSHAPRQATAFSSGRRCLARRHGALRHRRDSARAEGHPGVLALGVREAHPLVRARNPGVGEDVVHGEPRVVVRVSQARDEVTCFRRQLAEGAEVVGRPPEAGERGPLGVPHGVDAHEAHVAVHVSVLGGHAREAVAEEDAQGEGVRVDRCGHHHVLDGAAHRALARLEAPLLVHLGRRELLGARRHHVEVEAGGARPPPGRVRGEGGRALARAGLRRGAFPGGGGAPAAPVGKRGLRRAHREERGVPARGVEHGGGAGGVVVIAVCVPGQGEGRLGRMVRVLIHEGRRK